MGCEKRLRNGLARAPKTVAHLWFESELKWSEERDPFHMGLGLRSDADASSPQPEVVAPPALKTLPPATPSGVQASVMQSAAPTATCAFAAGAAKGEAGSRPHSGGWLSAAAGANAKVAARARRLTKPLYNVSTDREKCSDWSFSRSTGSLVGATGSSLRGAETTLLTGRLKGDPAKLKWCGSETAMASFQSLARPATVSAGSRSRSGPNRFVDSGNGANAWTVGSRGRHGLGSESRLFTR
eukprot:TRINITY_DN37526_c0_g1_i1.p1 TRINITY_DN37526_c0_g1~~TRINITY_DN37526_c0_g1_i1.p1  ORF type:complete len:262 (+),score=35.41 TRINITY_DN37526_c0_g1_i1:66-788(+)